MCVARNGIGYIAQLPVRMCGCRAQFQAFARHIYQMLLFGSGFAYDKHARCVAVIAFVYGRYINIHNIAFQQLFFVVGYSVADDLVYARTNTLREAFIV